jgi:hypothetical protein
VGAAAEFVKKWVNDMMDNKVSLNQLILTKSLRSEYKAATPPAHKVLANRITERDPGNAPASGDRLSFIYFKPPANFRGTQSDRIETPAFMKEHGLKPDPQYYIEHQLENPVGQLFSILVDQLPGARPPPQGWSADPDIQVAERELYARDYLFKAPKQKHTNTILSMWKIPQESQKAPVAQSITTRMRTRAVIAAEEASQKSQRRLTRSEQLAMDMMLVETIKKEKRKDSKKYMQVEITVVPKEKIKMIQFMENKNRRRNLDIPGRIRNRLQPSRTHIPSTTNTTTTTTTNTTNRRRILANKPL